jgi:TRAP-type C4-dicarboxylate transport system substrate-binding protein
MFALNKKSFLFVFAMSSLLVFLIVGGVVNFAKAAPVQLAVDKPISLKFHGIKPPGNRLLKEEDQYFMNLVGERSKGQVKFAFYTVDQLLKGPDMLFGIQTKIVDMGFVISTYKPKELPLNNVFQLPLLFPSGDYSTYYRAAWSLYKEKSALHNEWSKFNQKILYAQTPGFYHVFSKAPITKIEDFKGKKLKGPGGYMNLLINELGATSISISNADVFTALERGTIDGLLFNITSYQGFRLFELAKYATICGISAACGGLNINIDVWNSLPQNIKDIMTKAGEDTMANLARAEGELDKGILERLEKEEGVKIQTLAPQELERWKEKAKPLLGKWVKEQGKEGQEVLDFLMKEIKAR